MSNRWLFILVAIAFVAGLPVASASAFWTGYGGTLTGSGQSGTSTVNRGSTPTATLSGANSIAVSWGPSTLSNGLVATGYDIRRYDEATGVETETESECAGAVTGLSCTEHAVPDGEWTYSVTPLYADNWKGEEGAASGSVVVGSASITLEKSVFGAPLPTTTTGSLAGFEAGVDVAYTLDDGTAISGSPTTVESDGTATITSLEIPDVADGAHTIHVNEVEPDPGGPDPRDSASATILIDTTPPTVNAFVSPAPNAAGWNQGPVDLDASSDDGTGSGVDFLKGTGDGSDPRTSPTSQTWDGVPVVLPVSTVVKYYAVDEAGNESAVRTLPVQIDDTAPLPSVVEAIDVTGGVYVTLSATDPPYIYYRGVDAGSFRLRIAGTDTTPTPQFGPASGLISAGTSALTDSPIGFTHVSDTISTPAGGPFDSTSYSWVAGTTSSPSGALTLTDAAGNFTSAPGNLVNDSTPPAGGSVDATGLTGTGGRYSTSTTLHLALASGTDAGSNLADSGSRLLRASAPLEASGNAVICGTYDSYVQVGADDPDAAVTDTVPAGDLCYRYQYSVPDRVGNIATYTSPDIKVVTGTPPTLRPSGVTIDSVSGLGPQWVAGTTAYYRPSQSGSFTVSAQSSDPLSGVARVDFPVVEGFTGGGVHTIPATGSTYSATYAWANNPGSPSPGIQSISATNNAGGTSSNPSAFSIVADVTAPSGGSVDASGLTGTGSRYSTSRSLSLTLNRGTDSESGIYLPGVVLTRASASLTSDGSANGTCGTFGSYNQVGAADPGTPFSDTVPVDHNCYRYQYSVPDNVGNVGVFTSPDIKVDTDAPPAPAISFSNLNNASWTGSGSTVYYRPASSSGSFTVNAVSADTTSGTASFTFPSLPAGWTGAPGSPGTRTYSWAASNPTAPSAGMVVRATNNAGSQATTSLTVTPTADATPPSGGSVSYTNGYSTNPTINISFTKGTDTGSGLATASGILQQASTTLAGGACGTFSGFSTVATNPSSAYSNPVTTGCYKFRYLISDNVGNHATYTSSSVTKVDQNSPTIAVSIIQANNAYSNFNGAVLYYRGSASGSFKYVIDVIDPESGAASVLYPSLATSGWSHSTQTVTTPTGGPYTSSTYSWTAGASNPGTQGNILATDLAGRQRSAVVTFTEDSVPPSGGSITYPDALISTLSVPITSSVGFDNSSGIVTPGVIKRDETTLNTNTHACGSFPATFATTVNLVGGNDTSVTDNHCYQYRYVTSDRVGNQTTYSPARITKVDLTP